MEKMIVYFCNQNLLGMIILMAISKFWVYLWSLQYWCVWQSTINLLT